MLDISVKTTLDKARKEFRDLSTAQLGRGIARAINHTLGVTKTSVNAEIRKVYKIRAKDIRPTLSVKRAYARQLMQTGLLLAKGTRLPLIGFRARQSKRGVSVNVMGTRALIKSAFIITTKSGQRGVFGRGTYKGGEFAFRNKRLKKSGNDLPITEMTTLSVPKAMSNSVILRHLSDKIATHFPQRLTHELMRIRGATSDVPADTPT